MHDLGDPALAQKCVREHNRLGDDALTNAVRGERLTLRRRKERVVGSPERRRLSQVVTEILVQRGEDHVDLPVAGLRLRPADLDDAHAEVDPSARERALLPNPEPTQRQGGDQGARWVGMLGIYGRRASRGDRREVGVRQVTSPTPETVVSSPRGPLWLEVTSALGVHRSARSSL
jgi:hypothetical protein